MTDSASPKLKVIHYVWINNSHVVALVSSLQSLGINASKSSPKVSKLIFQILLGPIMPIWYRLHGIQIIHLHWVAGQFKPMRFRSRFVNQFFYLWYLLFLKVCRTINLKVVWTAHNFLPHEPVFNNDLMARKHLVENSDTVIALNEEILESIKSNFRPRNIKLIWAAEPKISLELNRESNHTSHKSGNHQLNFSAIGHVRPYKGPDIFLRAINGLQSSSRFSVAGATNDAIYESEISELAKLAIASGIDLEVNLKFLSDSELSDHFMKADFLVCPFRQISNSGIINLAMDNGIPLILPDLPSLGWVPRAAALWFDGESAETGLRQSILTAETLSIDARNAMSEAGREFMKPRGWDNYVAEHIKVYRNLVD